MAVAVRANVLRAWLYIRISKSRDGDDLGVRRQERLCRTKADQSGAEVYEVVQDNDVSATRSRRRPGFERLLQAVEAGLVDVIYAVRSDRLLRKPGDLERLFEACEKASVSVVYVDGQGWNAVTSEGMFEARIRAAMDAEEVAKLKKRVRDKVDELAQDGKISGGGGRPFGYEDDRMTVREDEARLVQEAKRRIVAGETARAVIRDWTARGITGTNGTPFSPQTFKRVICSWRLCGIRSQHDVPVSNAEWVAIFTRAETERLRSILMDPARRTSHSNSRSYLLTGFLFCGVCGAKMVARPRGDKRRSQCCASDQGGCGKTRTLSDPVEELVAEAILHAVDPALIRRAIREETKDDEREARVVAEIRADDASLEELANDFYVQRVITRPQFLNAKGKLEERVAANRKRLSADKGTGVLAGLPDTGNGLRDAWETRDLDWRRAVVSALIDRVIVNPGLKGRTKFDPSRFEIVWKV